MDLIQALSVNCMFCNPLLQTFPLLYRYDGASELKRFLDCRRWWVIHVGSSMGATRSYFVETC